MMDRHLSLPCTEIAPHPGVSSHSPVPPAETPLLASSTLSGVVARCLISRSHRPQMWCPDLKCISAHASPELREDADRCPHCPFPRPALSAPARSVSPWVRCMAVLPHGDAANAWKAPISSGKCHPLEEEVVLLSILCLMWPFASEPHNYFYCMEEKGRRWWNYSMEESQGVVISDLNLIWAQVAWVFYYGCEQVLVRHRPFPLKTDWNLDQGSAE